MGSGDYLLDTDVLSELERARPNERVLERIHAIPVSSLHLSVVTIGEVRNGAERVRAGRPEHTAALERWLARTAEEFGTRVLDIDRAVADRWGRLRAELVATPITTADALIAATALVHDCTLLTRNTEHFVWTGVRLLNPFEEPLDR